MVKIRYILGILALCGGFGGAAEAQFFSGAQSTAQSYDSTAGAEQSKSLPAADNSAGFGDKGSVADASSDKKAEDVDDNENTFSPVETNFNGQQKKDNTDNEERHVFHFKIVNGKVTVDNDKQRSVLIFYDNYQIHRGFDKMIKCTIRVNVLNDLPEKITALGFKLKWPDIMTSVEMNQVKPGVTTYTDLMLLGEGCLKLDKTPTIEVNRCRVKGMRQEDCADAIKWFPKKQR